MKRSISVQRYSSSQKAPKGGAQSMPLKKELELLLKGAQHDTRQNMSAVGAAIEIETNLILLQYTSELIMEISIICKCEAKTELEKMLMLDRQIAMVCARSMSVSASFCSSTMPESQFVARERLAFVMLISVVTRNVRYEEKRNICAKLFVLVL